MKIVIVLSSLATFAIAVPVNQENFIESSLINKPLSTKRERKSTLPDITPGLAPENGIEKIPIQSRKTSGPETSVEVKNFRRPIIIKRKFGYHVYRDSDEEMAHAEPGEKCREQVKFKLCDHEPVLSSKNGIKSPTFKCVENYKTDNEMENSIKMAKEAVEYLQRDLKRMENFSPKMGNPHTEDIESNTGLHHDIEIAREALEHIEQNFESVNMEVNKVNELQISKLQDEERLTRWREAIENIHKNFEIVKNIEDAFKSDNHYSLVLSNSRTAVESEEPDHSEGHVNGDHKLTNDNLENNDENYNVDRILKSASNEIVMAQVRPKTEYDDFIGKEAGNDMFISPTENRKENMQLHSDSLKSVVNAKDTSLRNDDSEIKTSKLDTIVPEESIKYLRKNSDSEDSLSEVAFSEHEKTMIDHIDDDHELWAKDSSSFSESLHENVKNEEQKGIDKFQLMMKSALPQGENRNPIIKMKSVKEILNNKKDQEKTAKSNEENSNGFEKSKNENIPLEKLSSVPKSTIPETSDNFKVGGEENTYYDKHNNKVFEDNQKQHEAYNENMRLSNDQLVKSEQLSPDTIITIDQDVIKSPHLFSLKEKNVFSGEEKVETDNINIFSANDKPNTLNREQSIRTSQNLNEPLAITLYETKHEGREVYEPLIMSSEKDNHPENLKLDFSKSVPEVYSDPIALIPTDKADTIEDQHSYKGEASIRSSESQNEKLQLNEYQAGPEYSSMRLDIENNSEYPNSQFSKSVPELLSDSAVLKSAEKVDFTYDENSHEGEGSTRSSDSQNKKMQLNENQKVYETLPMRLDIENHPEDHTQQFFKSVPELQSDPMASLPTDKVDITNDQNSHTEKVNMRSSEIRNEKMGLNENQEVYELLPMSSDLEHNPEDRTWQFSKSVPDLPSDPNVSMATDKVDITYDQHFDKGEESSRSSESQNEKLQINEYQAGPEYSSMRLDIENNSEYPNSQFSKSVNELLSESTVLKPAEKVDFTYDENSHEDDGSTRSSDSQNKKMQFNENQEVYETLPMRLDIEHHPEERIWQLSKSVPDIPSDPMASMPTDKVDITKDQNSHRQEANMRSSESKNEEMELNENQEVYEPLSMSLDIDHHPEEPLWQLSKSVPDIPSDPMASLPTDKVDITKDQSSHREEANMGSSDSKNEKMELNENQEVYEPLAMGLDFEHQPEDRTWQFSKSVPDLPSDPMVSMPTDKVDIIDDQHFYKGKESSRSSESKNEKLQSNEYQEGPDHSKLEVENNFEFLKPQFSKSVSETSSDSTVLKPTEKVDFTYDENSHKGDGSTRSTESQNKKMQLNENQGVYETMSTSLDIEHHPEDHTWQLSKSVPDLPSDPMVSMPTHKIDITDAQHFNKGEGSSRSSESQNEKLQSNEYQEGPDQSILDVVNNSEYPKSQFYKSVPELLSDSTVSKPTDKADSTDDQYFYKSEESMRSSESQNEKMQLNENLAVYEPLPMILDIEHHPEDKTWQISKSVPDVPSDSILLMPTDKVDITVDQHSHKSEGITRLSESQNEKLQLNDHQEGTEPSSMRLDVENKSEYPKTHFAKSVPELISDSTVSKPTDKINFTDDENFHKGGGSTRSSESKNEKNQLNENQELHEPLSTALDTTNHPDNHLWPFSKSVPEPILSISTDKVDITNDQSSLKEVPSMRLSQSQSEKLQLNENEEVHYPNDNLSQLYKFVPELYPDSLVSMSADKVEITSDQRSLKNEAIMRLSDSQNGKLKINENQKVSEPLPMSLDIEPHPERTWQFSKSVSELLSDPMVSIPTHKEEASMRLTQTQNEKLQFNENHDPHEPLPTRLDMSNRPEDSKWQFSKSVPDLPSDPMVSMPTDNVEITNEQHSLKEWNMRLSQNQNERTRFDDNLGLHDPLLSKLSTENHPQYNTLQLFKSAPELYMIPSDINHANNEKVIQEEARLSQNHNERQHMNFNDHLHEPLSSRINIEKKIEYESPQAFKSVQGVHSEHMLPIDANKVRFSYEGNPIEDQTIMRLTQNQNKEIQYPRRGLGVSNEHMYRKDNAEHNMNDFMRLSVGQHQQLHENRDPMLWSSNEREHLSHNFKSLPEYKSTYEYRTRPQIFRDHILDETQSSRWFQTKQHNDHFANYYKTIPEGHEEHMNPHFRKHFHKAPVNHRLNDVDSFNSHDFPSSRARLDDMQKYHPEKSSNIDSSIEPSMPMSIREPFAKSGTEFNDMHFNHPHGTARFGLPIPSASSGAVGVFPTANAGGCGIPLLLSCSPSVVSGSLARPHIGGPVFKSADDNFKYYIKRNAYNIADVPVIKGQKTSLPHNHETETITEIKNNRKI